MPRSAHRLALTMALGLAACPDEHVSATTATAAESAVEETVMDAAGTNPPIVRVFETGAEPREPLERERIAREREVTLDWDMSAPARPSDRSMHVRLALTWSASDARETPARFSIQRADVTMPEASDAEAKVGEAIESYYAVMAGHARRRGPAHVEFVQTKGMVGQPGVPWMLHLFAFVPPSEPLGPGASWTMESQHEADRMSCTEKRSYRIDAVTRDEVTARLQLDLRCEPAKGAPEGAPSIAYSMRGDLRFARTEVLATSGEIESTIRTIFPALASEPSDKPIGLDATLTVALRSTPR